MIDTKAIRNKILDLAVRGKLTEQLSEDGTAEELFRQIQAEKQALIKAGKIKKEKNENVKIGIYNADSRELKNIYTALSAMKLVPNAVISILNWNAVSRMSKWQI